MLGYVSGVYDVLRKKELERLNMASQVSQEKGNEYFAVAVYSDELCTKLGLGEPLKKVEDRIKIIQYINGVDFAFPIDGIEEDEIENCARNALEEYQNNHNMIPTTPKEFGIVYAPGTYDLFHAGHLENLLEAAKRGEKLIVGVKADELVQSHKGKKPMLDAQERMDILRYFSFVEDVYRYYTRDPHIAVKWIERKYGEKVDAIFMGSDLESDFKYIKDIKIVFTSRNSQKMKSRSSSAYAKKLRLHSFSDKQRFTRPKENSIGSLEQGDKTI